MHLLQLEDKVCDFCLVYLQLNKKKAKAEGKKCHENYVESVKADRAYFKNSPHVPLRQNAEGKERGKYT
jgi:hypothetical protein